MPRHLLASLLLTCLLIPAASPGATAAESSSPSTAADTHSMTSGGLPAATVLGTDVRTSDAAELQQAVLTRLFDRYATEQGIEVTDAEINAFVDNMRRGMRASGLDAEDGLTPEEAVQADRMRRDMGRAMIRQWKLNRALYQQYGGRIIFQQFGPEPLDAYRTYLLERQAAGDFTIHRKELEAGFWQYFTDDSLHDFYEPGSEAERQAFRLPPWEQESTDSSADSLTRESAPAGNGPLASRPDAVLENALRAAEPDYTHEIVAITASKGRYVYGYADLNEDGRSEVLVLLMGPFFCGTGGCTLHIFTETGTGYSLVNTFPRSRLPVIASPRKTAGWYDIFRLETGGGASPSYVRHVFDGEKYVERERLPAQPAPGGARLLDGDYSFATGFTLEPGSDQSR